MARCWAVVPAAGVGRRMGSEIPKQYLPLLGRPVLLHTLEKIAATPGIDEIVVAVSAGDPWWATVETAFGRPLRVVEGGAERVHSVFNAVASVAVGAEGDDWLLVHDAARPCVTVADIARLMEAVADHDCGGILATPVRDTMKLATDAGTIHRTVDRSHLWHALTPQLFRAPLLLQALRDGLRHPERITDEASALELAGYSPLLVEGRADNLKITRPEDLALAEFYLRREGQG